MRVSELSRRSRVPIPTIKFYLREGLLPPGDSMGPRQAEYSPEHLRRLRLIRALSEAGGLKLQQVRAVLRAIDDQKLPIHRLLGVAHHALGPPSDQSEPPPDVVEARAEVDRFLARLGWRVSEEAPARRALADALVTLRRMGRDADARVFERYARVADRVAAREVASVADAGSRAETVEQAVVGTVAFEVALVALRRLAQEHHSALRFSAKEGRG
jgi:DNA-binding transcriptional MerR regulator